MNPYKVFVRKVQKEIGRHGKGYIAFGKTGEEYFMDSRDIWKGGKVLKRPKWRVIWEKLPARLKQLVEKEIASRYTGKAK